LDVGIHRRFAHEGDAAWGEGFAKGTEHRPAMDRARRWNRGVGITHLSPHNRASLHHQLRANTEETRLPQHQIGKLPGFDRPHLGTDAMGQGRVDRHLGDVALQAMVVVAAGVLRQCTPLHFHLVGGLEGAGDHFSHTTHGLGVAGDDREGAEVVKDVFSGDRLAADPRFGEGHILGNLGVEVVAHHQHVEVLLERVAGVGPGGIGAARQHIRFAADLDDVGGMATTGPFGMKGVDRASLDGGDRVLDEAGLVQGVGVDAHLHIHAVRHR